MKILDDADLSEVQKGAVITDDVSNRLSHAGQLICGLQEFSARSTLFLPPYDQRLANDAVLNLHAAVSQMRQRLFPRNSFKFKNRRCPPANVTTLISEMWKEVGSTSDILRLQGDTHEDVLDPRLCFVDCVGETLIKSAGEINGGDFVLSRLKDCTVWLSDVCGSVRADRLENCKIFLGPVRSVLVEKIERCTFQLASQQLRIHSAMVLSPSLFLSYERMFNLMHDGIEMSQRYKFSVMQFSQCAQSVSYPILAGVRFLRQNQKVQN